MSDDSDSLLFPKSFKPDDYKDYTEKIIWLMRTGYRRHYGIIESPPEVKKPKKTAFRKKKK